MLFLNINRTHHLNSLLRSFLFAIYILSAIGPLQSNAREFVLGELDAAFRNSDVAKVRSFFSKYPQIHQLEFSLKKRILRSIAMGPAAGSQQTELLQFVLDQPWMNSQLIADGIIQAIREQQFEMVVQLTSDKRLQISDLMATERGEGPFFRASIEKNFEIFRHLAELPGMDINFINPNGYSVLWSQLIQAILKSSVTFWPTPS